MKEETIREAMARAGIYRLLSAAFLYPDEALVTSLRETSSKIEVALPDPFPFESGGHGLQEVLATVSSATFTPDGLQAEYRRTFGHTISRECPPYETEYGSAHLFQQAQRLGDIAGFYRAFGLEVSDQAKERLDHIAVELEFMGFLTWKEAYALTHHGEEQAAICREAQKKFLEEHLGRWAPLFVKLLGRKAQEGFYRQMASLLDAFLTAECRRLGVRPLTFHEGDLVPNTDEAEGACFPCGVKDLCIRESEEEE